MNNQFTPGRRHQNSSASFTINTLQLRNDRNEADYEISHCNHLYEIIWVTSGLIRHWTDLQESVNEGQRFYFTAPGQIHRFTIDDSTRGFHICFTESFLDMEDQHSDSTYYNSLFRLFSAPAGISLGSKPAADFQEIMERMIMEYSNSNLFRTEVLRRYFKIFLIYLTRIFEDQMLETKYSRNAELLQKFMCSLEKKYKTQKMVSEYAAELQVTPNYLNEIIKKMTGFSAGYHIRNRIVLEAKRLCRHSDNCMKEIAYHLGFCDSAHFSKFFKSIAGVNFSEFKKDQVFYLPAA